MKPGTLVLSPTHLTEPMGYLKVRKAHAYRPPMPPSVGHHTVVGEIAAIGRKAR